MTVITGFPTPGNICGAPENPDYFVVGETHEGEGDDEEGEDAGDDVGKLIALVPGRGTLCEVDGRLVEALKVLRHCLQDN